MTEIKMLPWTSIVPFTPDRRVVEPVDLESDKMRRSGHPSRSQFAGFQQSLPEPLSSERWLHDHAPQSDIRSAWHPKGMQKKIINIFNGAERAICSLLDSCYESLEVHAPGGQPRHAAMLSSASCCVRSTMPAIIGMLLELALVLAPSKLPSLLSAKPNSLGRPMSVTFLGPMNCIRHCRSMSAKCRTCV